MAHLNIFSRCSIASRVCFWKFHTHTNNPRLPQIYTNKSLLGFPPSISFHTLPWTKKFTNKPLNESLFLMISLNFSLVEGETWVLVQSSTIFKACKAYSLLKEINLIRFVWEFMLTHFTLLTDNPCRKLKSQRTLSLTYLITPFPRLKISKTNPHRPAF